MFDNEVVNTELVLNQSRRSIELNQKNYTFSAYSILRAFSIRLIKNV
jgi:hypothetical protein